MLRHCVIATAAAGLSAALVPAALGQITAVQSQSGVYQASDQGLADGAFAYTGNTDADASRWTNVPAELQGISYALTEGGNATTDPLTVTSTVTGPTTFYVFHSDRSVDPDLIDMDDVDGRPQWLLDNYTDTGLNIGLTNGLPDGGIETFSVFSQDITQSGTVQVETFLNDPSTGGSFSMYGLAAAGQPIPEPATLSLAAVAGGFLVRRRR